MASQLRQYSLSCNKNPNLHSFDFFLFFLSGFTSVAEVATVLAKVFMCASILMLVALTWERHFAICSPHQYRIHIRTTPRWRHLCRYFIPVMLCSILFNIPTFINIEVCTALRTVGQDLQKCKETSNLDVERRKTSGPLVDKQQKMGENLENIRFS